jgi:hypothetical protein
MNKKLSHKIFIMAIAVVVSLSLVACKPMSPVNSPTASSTPVTAPTEKPTATIASTPTLERFAIDLEKVHRVPQNMEDLRNNPSKFQELPNPLTDLAYFWEKYDELCSQLADIKNRDYSKMQVNYQITSISGGEGVYLMMGAGEMQMSQPLFFFFRNGDTFYPAYIILSERDGYLTKPFTVILFDHKGDGDFSNVNSTVAKIAEGGYKLKAYGVRTEPAYMFPNVVDSLISQGFSGGYGSEEHFGIGFGSISFLS